MNKLKKIVFSILFIFCISMINQNISYALDENNDKWDDTRSFSIGSVEEKSVDGYGIRTIFHSTHPNTNYRINWSHNVNKWEWNGNKSENWPALDGAIGVICIQHNKDATDTVEEKNDKGETIYTKVKPVLRNYITVSGSIGTVIRGYGGMANNDNTGLIAYILSYMNNGSNAYPISEGGRKGSGSQGALWLACTEYYNTFPGKADTDFADSITESDSKYNSWVTQRAKNIYKIASKYNQMIKSIKSTSVSQGNGFKWKVDSTGENYIIGPFNASYNDVSLNYGVNNSNFTRLAGITSTSLTDGNGTGIAFSYCDSSGGSGNIGGTFYIKVSKASLKGKNLGKLKFTINDQYLKVDASWWDIRCVGFQRRLYVPNVNSYYVPGSGSVEFSPSGLTIEKVDKDSGKGIQGMQFKIKLDGKLWVTNIGSNSSMASFSTNEGSAGTFTTDGGGHIYLPRTVDGYYEIIEVGVGNNWQYEVPSNNVFGVTVNRNNPTKRIENVKTFIKINGYAWVDRGNDGKETSRDNLYKSGTKDKLLQNVDVKLKHKTNANFTNDGRAITATTNSSGAYEFIVRRSEVENLYIEFDYDGLQYQNVTPNAASNGSKAAEGSDRRDPFNAKFSTIEGNGDNTGYTLDANGNKSQNLEYTKQNHESKLKNVETTENATTVTITNKGKYHIQSDTTKANYVFKNPGTGVDVIGNVNLGLYERTQPDLAVVKDIQNVRLSINGRNHVYDYNQRVEATNNEQTSGFNVGVKFENSYKTKYKRAIYRSDYEYTSDDKSRELQVYITYKIVIRNQSSSVETEVNRIAEYYDSRYEVVNVGKTLSADGSTITDLITNYRKDESYNNANYAKLIIEPDLGTIGAGQNKEVYVQFHLGREAVVDILNGRENLDNFVEITSYSSIKDGKPYAGVDIDSNPGNADPTNEETVEDDTDISPTLLLEVANAREMTGTVFVDEAIPQNEKNPNEVMTGEIRQGDGIYDSSENTLGNVDITFKEEPEEGNKGVTYITKTVENPGIYKFKLEYYNEDGDKFEERFERLYVNGNDLTQTNEEADFSSELPAGTIVRITPTPVDGTEEQDKIYTKELEKGEFFLLGYIPGDYTLTYTWGGQTYELNGKTETVSVQNYKATIYDYNRYLENYVGINGNEPNKNWYDVITYDENSNIIRYNDAMDDYTTREAIDANFTTIDNTTPRGDEYLNAGTYITKMDSTTPVMNIDVEYKIGETKPTEGNNTEITDRYVNSDKYVNLVPNIDFGVIRRAKQDYVIEKRISAMKITLANGRVLADLQVVEKDGERVLEGTKTGATYMKPSEIQSNGMLRFEMDSELIQGSKVELTYEYIIRNTSEVDYLTEEYYHFGTQPSTDDDKKNNIVTIAPSKMMDYLDKDWGYEAAAQNTEYKWTVTIPTDVKLLEDVTKSQGYSNTQKIFTNCGSEWKLDPLFNPQQNIKLNVSKLLSSSQDIELNNEVEIVEITKNGGGDIEEDIIPGNYVPTGDGQVDVTEPDDDKAETLTITPNTGENRNYTIPIIITLTISVILIGGIVFIKKKILDK